MEDLALLTTCCLQAVSGNDGSLTQVVGRKVRGGSHTFPRFILSSGFALVSWGPVDSPTWYLRMQMLTFIGSEQGSVGVEDAYCRPQSLKGDNVTWAEGSSGGLAKKGQAFSESWCQALAARSAPVSDSRAARTSVRLSLH